MGSGSNTGNPDPYIALEQLVYEFLFAKSSHRSESRLYIRFPTADKEKLREYFQKWKDDNYNLLKDYVKDITTILYILNYKYIIEKQLSAEEQKSIKRLGSLVDSFDKNED